MSTLIQRAFSGGEITTDLYARVDITKYATGLRTLRNFYVMRHGGATNRPGTQFVTEVSDSSKKIRLLPFIFNTDQTYVIEVGENYIRIIKDGIQLTETATTITGIDNASPIEVTTSAAHGYTSGDEVNISGVVGITEVNSRNFKIAVTGASTFTLFENDGITAVSGSTYGTYTSGGSAAKVFTLDTTYLEADLPELKFVQSGDVITLTHPKYPVKELNRAGPTDIDWTLTEITFEPVQKAPTVVSVTGGGVAPTKAYTYVATAINDENSEESISSNEVTSGAIGAATSVNPHVITWTAPVSGGATNYNVYQIQNGIGAFVGIAKGLTFNYDGILPPDIADAPPTLKNPFSDFKISGITAAEPPVVTFAPSQAGTPTTQKIENGDILTITGVVGMTEVNGGTYLAANKTNTTVELQDTVGVDIDGTGFSAWTSGGDLGIGNYPSAVGYYQQRLIFANNLDNSEKVNASKSGNFHNFTTSTPIQDDDAIAFTMAGRQVNAVRHILDLGQLILFTQGGEASVQGDDSGILKPTGINPRTQSYNGASSLLRPIPIDSSALYVQARGSIIRDLGFDFTSDTFKGSDLSIFSAHLFDGFQLVDWDFAQVPQRLLWVVRDDGALLSLTFVREQELFAWARHDFTDGQCENITVVPEGNEDVPYVVVKRTINGVTKRYIERFSTRDFTDIKNAKFMDSSLTFDGRNTSTTTMTISNITATITGITNANPGVVTTAAPHGLLDGTVISITGVTGMTEVSGDYVVADSTASTFSLKTTAGVPVDTTSFSSYVSLGTIVSAYDGGSSLTLTASAGFFVAADVGNQIQMTDSNGDILRFDINAFTSTTVVTGKANRDVPAILQGVAITKWALAVDELGGLWHLEGETISVLGDAFVVASPDNEAYLQLTVSNGSITLEKPYAVLHAGAPITADIETLDIDTPQGESIIDKNKKVSNVNIYVESSRGIWAGPQPPVGSDPLENLTEFKLRQNEGYDDPVDEKTDVVRVLSQSKWNNNGRVFIRQIDPLPLSVLAIAPEGMYPFTKGGG